MKEHIDMNESHPAPVAQSQHRRTLRRGGIAVVIVLLALGMAAGRILWIRHDRAHQLETSTPSLARQYVVTIFPQPNKDNNRIELPGTLQGFIESPIYARSNGYLVRWYKDIGSQVKKGEVLAEIDTPEVDQQLTQAIATRRQMAATLDLTKISMDRWEQMHQRDVVSQQELDERRSAYAQTEASLNAADAEVRRLQDLESFKRVVAPFSGIVTRRNVDIGDLVSPGNGSSAHALFLMSQADPLRVYVYVPQSYAGWMKPGQKVEIRQSEMPGQVFSGRIERTAGAIDTSTRTLQVEIHLPNPEGLLPGSYVKVSLTAGATKALTIPSNALLFRPEGPRVAIIGQNGSVRLQAVSIGQDFGTKVEILEGIRETDRLILNPSDALADGDVVTAKDQPAKAGART
ncbi:antibiotic efflux pump periplasmic linker protein ArpA precursor [mine drainage metagenome]|uniref:Antibiotic efflux pump periplasmic linker protein ArpA n=1 Tax=mine drainage metagenome TaxID=410659 RepID=A0A1J5QI23_9ZZZZ